MNKKRLLLLIFAVFLLIPVNFALGLSQEKSGSELEGLKKKFIPQEFYLDYDEFCDGNLYKYDSFWQKYESFDKVNLDEDPALEVVIQFTGAAEAQIRIPRAVVMVVDGLEKYLLGVDMYPGNVEFYDVDNDADQEIISFSHSGAHYTKIVVFDYKSGNPEGEKFIEVFNNGSACPVYFEVKDNRPLIRIGKANWEQEDWCYASGEPLWQVYAWNGEEFVYDESLSTTPEIGEWEEVGRYVEQIEKTIEDIQDE
jgi:hypothetical protein